MAASESIYDALLAGARLISPLLSRGDGKLARGVRGRAGAADRIVGWAEAHRDLTRPLAWFHAPSVGEGLQARAVVEVLRGRRPELQLLFTHFSPSAEGIAGSMPADCADYLPWDSRAHATRVVDAVRPAVVAFTKTEVWPGLSRAAAQRGVPTVLIAGTLQAGSTRDGVMARWLLGPSFARLRETLAIAPSDGSGFVRMGAEPSRVLVTGDPGVDSAASRVDETDPKAPFLLPFHDDPRPTLVAGSTWPSDEAVLLEACTRIRVEHPELRLVIAPHEPGEGHVGPLEAGLADRGWQVARLGRVEATGTVRGLDAVVVDRVGVLVHLYTLGDVAFVGGGFHGLGLHSVLEPAAAGIPVVFGSRYRGSRAAIDLVENGAGRHVATVDELETALRDWLLQSDAAARWGQVASGYIERHRGAADRTAERILALIGGAG